MDIKTLLFVIPGGILGVLARHFGAIAVTRLYSGSFPLHTFLINCLGSFLIGVVYVIGVERPFLSPEFRTGIMVGFLGGFTTFSSYSLESVRLLEAGNFSTGLLYSVMTNLTGFLLTFSGILLARRFFV